MEDRILEDSVQPLPNALYGLRESVDFEVASSLMRSDAIERGEELGW